MLRNNIQSALIELSEEIERILSHRIDEYGYNARAKKNTLKGSNLEKSIKVAPIENGVALQIADYWWYVAKGWKRTKNSPERGLYHNLVLWALRKHIMVEGYTQNVSAVIVAEKVWKTMIVYGRPIAAREFMIPDKNGELDVMIPELKKYMKKWFTELFEQIMKVITEFFKD